MKNFKRKRAVPVSAYNHDAEHPDHIGRTIINESLTWQSKALQKYGWNEIDEYEKLSSHKNKKNNAMREYIYSLPNHWYKEDDFSLVKQWRDETIEEISRDLGVNKENLFIEIVFHYNKGETKDKDNFHCHLMIGERELIETAEYECHKQDRFINAKGHASSLEKARENSVIYNQEKRLYERVQIVTETKVSLKGKEYEGIKDFKRTGVFLTKEEVKSLGLIKCYRQGDIKVDEKTGKNKVLSTGGHLSPKIEYMKKKVFLQRQKERFKEIAEGLDSSLDLTVGKKDSVLDVVADYQNGSTKEMSLKLPMLTWVRSEEKKYPERVKIMKEINEQRRWINRSHKLLLQTNTMPIKYVYGGVYACKSEEIWDEEKTPSKVSYFQRVKDITGDVIDGIVQMKEEVYAKLNRVRNRLGKIATEIRSIEERIEQLTKPREVVVETVGYDRTERVVHHPQQSYSYLNDIKSRAKQRKKKQDIDKKWVNILVDDLYPNGPSIKDVIQWYVDNRDDFRKFYYSLDENQRFELEDKVDDQYWKNYEQKKEQEEELEW